MELQKIKILCRNRPGGIRKLATEIGMTEANLHRCIRECKIQAHVLENISRKLGVPINEFFSEDLLEIRKQVTYGNNSPIGNSNEIASNITVSNYKQKLQDKEELIESLRETIASLRETIEILKKTSK